MQNTKFSSVTLMESDTAINALTAILKFLEHSQKTFAVESIFSIVIGGRLDSINC